MAVSGDAAFLGGVLRKARIAAGITSAEKLADELGYERTVIAKAESGHRPPTPQLAALYAKRFPELNNLIASGLIEEWAEFARENTPASTGNFGMWVDHEEEASALLYWQPIMMPGIVQTEGYVREVLRAKPSKEPLDVLVADRMARQRIFDRPEPPVVSVILAEAALRRCVGGPEIMREQLTYLAEHPHPKLVVQVIPAQVPVHPGLEGALSIADREDGRTIVLLDSPVVWETTGEPEIVARAREVTDLLRAEALPRGASRERILEVVNQL